MSTKLSYESREGRVEVEVPRDDMTIDDVVSGLVVPVLLGAGYATGSVKSVIQTDVL